MGMDDEIQETVLNLLLKKGYSVEVASKIVSGLPYEGEGRLWSRLISRWVNGRDLLPEIDEIPVRRTEPFWLKVDLVQDNEDGTVDVEVDLLAEPLGTGLDTMSIVNELWEGRPEPRNYRIHRVPCPSTLPAPLYIKVMPVDDGTAIILIKELREDAAPSVSDS